MKKNFYVIGNWKMNPPSVKGAKKLLTGIKKGARDLKNVKLVVCPPYVYLGFAKSSPQISVGAQDVSADGPVGPYTGEISLEMLKNLGVSYIILGHSERRERGESNVLIGNKIRLALKAGFNVVFCVGEKEKDNSEASLGYIRAELGEGLKGIDRKILRNLIIAYEPIWALSNNSKGISASPAHAFKMALYIRKVLAGMAGETFAKAVPILYGGSVSKENIGDFLADGWLQGALVGSKSLNAKEFISVAKVASALA